MSARLLLDPSTKAEVADLVREIEAQTSAEIVVVVREVSGVYRHTDWLVGAALAFVSLLVFLFHPAPFDDDLLPIEIALAFAFGALASARIGALRRALTSKKLMADNVHRAACAAFMDLGVWRPRDRTGLLVYLSTFERRVDVVTDIGIDVASLGPGFTEARAVLDQSASPPSAAGFFAGLRALASPLAAALPRAEDDVNELPDEVQ